ncbi:forkhead box protein H1 [Athene noctua]|uniref:forkhead box protein H1 n=1 Tax=Athene noctua TaxID=126797 RepID=UPI003EBD21A8
MRARLKTQPPLSCCTLRARSSARFPAASTHGCPLYPLPFSGAGNKQAAARRRPPTAPGPLAVRTARMRMLLAVRKVTALAASSRPSSGSRAAAGANAGRPPRYRRHPKPPYSYLALIALVIRAAPGRRLKLSQILQQLRSLFPSFGGGYQGWRDSVRHNLSSNPCFAKVLKDPAKPKAKGNYWTVDVSLIPPAALRLQNTAVTRGGATAFARDLAPFVLRGHPYSCGVPAPPPDPPVNPPPSPPPAPPQPRRSPFSIASLLKEFPEGGDKPPPPPSGDPPPSPLWGSTLILHLPPPTWLPPPAAPPPHTPPSEQSGGSPDLDPPPRPPPTWGQLPTSYSTAVAPNAVAPPGGPPFLTLRWGMLPPPQPPSAPPGPALTSEGGAQAVPPNKTIFDIWLSHPGDIQHPILHAPPISGVTGSVARCHGERQRRPRPQQRQRSRQGRGRRLGDGGTPVLPGSASSLPARLALPAGRCRLRGEALGCGSPGLTVPNRQLPDSPRHAKLIPAESTALAQRYPEKPPVSWELSELDDRFFGEIRAE